MPNSSFTLIESIRLATKSAGLLNAMVVIGTPTLVLSSMTRLMSAPTLKVCRPWMTLRLSLQLSVVPISRSIWFGLRSVNPGTLATPTGAVPITG